MLSNIIHDADYAKLMQKNIQDTIVYLFKKEQHFGVLCKIEDVEFSPTLPEDIQEKFHPTTLFFLAGYTFETAKIENLVLTFEAGFGSDNYGSLVRIPLFSIMQIIVEETPILINLAQVNKIKNVINDKGVENSMNSFLTNPENSKFFK